ncbi:hypothetical protein [Nocardia asteroides]|uniref:hypothetical protein n=1 Tax=Nocardia asteroides TaxID=1824 RepID=UPI003442592F
MTETATTAAHDDVSEEGARSTADLEREVRTATRNGRYALIAALCAAVISSGVSAGSAIYVSQHQLDRTQRVEAVQMLRDSRQAAYTELVAALTAYIYGLGTLMGELGQTVPDREEIRAQVADLFGERWMRFGRALTGAELVGNEELRAAISDFGRTVTEFLTDHLQPFVSRNLAGPGGSVEDLRRDGPPLVTAAEQMAAAADDFTSTVVEQGRRDLGIGP